MDWFKVYSEGILRGSLSDSEDITQLIWVKLMAMANETRTRDGHLWFAPGHPYPREFIAQSCRVASPQLNYAVEIFLHEDYTDGTPRLVIEPDGTLFLKNWEKYQAKPTKKETESERVDPQPGDPESKDLRAKVATRKLAYYHPEDAEIGIKARQAEDAIRDKNKHLTQGGD